MKEEQVKITPIIDEWMKHDRYHHPAKGCDIIHKKKDDEGELQVFLFHCNSCDKEVSRGGWEWGWYGGTYNR